MWSFIEWILFGEQEEEEQEVTHEQERMIRDSLRPLLGLNPPYYTYHDYKKIVARKLRAILGEDAPSAYDLNLNICGSYERIRGLRIKWMDHEYEVGNFEDEMKN